MAHHISKAQLANLLLMGALLAYVDYAVASHPGGRRALQSWVPESGSFSVQTGVVTPSAVKHTTEVTWDHDVPPPEAPAAEPPAAEAPAPAPAAEDKHVKGPVIEATFNKDVKHEFEVNVPVATKEVLIKEKPSVEVAVDVNKGTVPEPPAEEAPAPEPEKETVYVIEKGHDCGCPSCACGH